MSSEQLWKDTEKEKKQYSKKSLFQCHLIHH